MRRLIAGIHTFRTTIFPERQALYTKQVEGQKPEYLFITCSDSRIQPAVMTQTDSGELFIYRNIGNIVPPHGVGDGVAAAVEYAVAELGVKHIIICGHTHCGAIKALLAPEHVAGSPAVLSWLQHAAATRRIIRENYSQLSVDDLYDVAIQENVLVQLEHLQTHPAVASAVVSGSLQLHGWVYRIETGEFEAYEGASHQFVPLDQVSWPESQPAPRVLPPRGAQRSPSGL